MTWVNLIVLLFATGLVAIAGLATVWWCLLSPRRGGEPDDEHFLNSNR